MKKKKEKKSSHIIIKLILLILLVALIIFSVWYINKSEEWVTFAKNSIDTYYEEADVQDNKSHVSISEMPDNLKNAYVSIEDQRFYSHFGIDIKRTGAAIISYVVNHGDASFGGSTITQQLVKNITGDDSDTISRKVKEWGKAIALEMYLSKEEILEAYLNILYIGPGIYGVEQGAKYYFNKNVSDLSLTECAFLAGINHSPNSYNPFREKDNSEKIQNRTNTVLDKMLELGYITQEEHDASEQEVNNGIIFTKGLF